MSVHYDESRPSPLQRQQSQTRTRLRAKIASRAVEDIPIFVGRKIAKPGVLKVLPLEGLDQKVDSSDYVLEIAIALRDIAPLPIFVKQGNFKIHEIQDEVCRGFKITRNDILSPRRYDGVVVPRQIAMALSKELTTKSLPEIGRRFLRDHTTVLHATRKFYPLIQAMGDILDSPSLEDIVLMAIKLRNKMFPPSRYSHR